MEQSTISGKFLKLDCNHGDEQQDLAIELDPNLIASHCYEAFKKLGKSGKPNPHKKEFTVLSGLVELDIRNKTEWIPRIICLATGTKCFPKNVPYRLEDIIDCHAEPLLKRAFKRYLIRLIGDWLEKQKQIDSQDNFYKEVMKNRSYCLFVSEAPCGSFSRWKGDINGENNNEMFKTVGVNRKPGRGELCPKAGCIHKIAKWRIFGLQGSQLLHITRRPITLSYIIIGNCESECFQFEPSLISKHLIVDHKEHSLIMNKLKVQLQFSQSTQVYFADQFRHEEFIRNDFHCGSSIVGWINDDKKTSWQCEILANGRRLGSVRRKIFPNDSPHLKGSKCDPGSSKICDFYLNKNIETLTAKFNQLCNPQPSEISKDYKDDWEILKKHLLIFKGWPTIKDTQ